MCGKLLIKKSSNESWLCPTGKYTLDEETPSELTFICNRLSTPTKIGHAIQTPPKRNPSKIGW
jgi:hypothetical protein